MPEILNDLSRRTALIVMQWMDVDVWFLCRDIPSCCKTNIAPGNESFGRCCFPILGRFGLFSGANWLLVPGSVGCFLMGPAMKRRKNTGFPGAIALANYICQSNDGLGVYQITNHFRYLKWRVSCTLFPAVLGGGFPLHKPYPYSLHRSGFLHFRYLKFLVIKHWKPMGVTLR